MSKAAALAAIKSADLSPTLYRVARELLDVASDDNGFVRLTLDDLFAVTNCSNLNAARRHLSDLQTANVLHYSINGDVYVTIAAFPARRISASTYQICAQIEPSSDDVPHDEHAAQIDAETPRAETVVPRAETVVPRAETVVPRAETVIPRAETVIPRAETARVRTESARAVTRTRMDGCLFPTQSVIEVDVKQTTIQTKTHEHEVDEQVVELLIAAGIWAVKARALAALCSRSEALRQIGAWMHAYEDGAVSTGLLVHRIEQHVAAPPVSAAFRQSAWYRDHVPYDFEESAWSSALSEDEDFYADEAVVEHVVETVASICPADDALAAAWHVVLVEMCDSRLSHTYTEPIRAASIAPAGEVDGCCAYLVTLPADAMLSLIRDRMGVGIRRSLSSVLHKRVVVEFALAGVSL